MVLSTVDAAGAPSGRVVLCRGIDDAGLRFFTNYESRKAVELEGNPRAAATFHWRRLRRQARVEGLVRKLSPDASDAYFAGRPRGSQLGAWASPQSRVIGSLDEVRARQAELASLHGEREVPRPPYWGGYALQPHALELWTEGADRLHERLLFTRSTDSAWVESRLAP